MASETPIYRFKRPSDKCVFDDAQWNMLAHIFETFVAGLTPEETEDLKKDYYKHIKNPADEKLLETYAQESALDLPEFLEDVDCVFQNHVPADKVAEIKTVLNILDTRLGALAFTGSTIPLYQKSRQEREEIISGWSTARMAALRKVFKAFATIARLFWARSSASWHAAAGFPGYPFSKEGEEELKITMEAAATAEANPEFVFEDLSQRAAGDGGTIQLSTSILIIGSGCGGGVVAGHLAKAIPHHQLMVVEKGFWYPKHKAPANERDGLKKLYEEGGTLQSNDGSLAVFAGSTWGGGSTINWGVSWQLPARTRREWNKKYGLPFVESPEFQDCLDYVSNVGKVQTWKENEHNPSNATIVNGSHRLGESYLTVPQNIEGDADAHNKICGAFCAISCKGSGAANVADRGGKVAVTKSYLADAREQGARFLQGFDVTRLVFDKKGNVTGAEGLWRADPSEPAGTGKKVFISAKKVVVSGGTLNTPVILQKSGLRNWWIGRNLHLHPVIFCLAEWKEETRPWEGSIISVANIEHTNLDNDGHGAVIEGMLMLPGLGTAILPWKNSLDFKKRMLRYNHLTNQVIICRDRDSGRIILDPKSGKGRVEYTVSEFDKTHLMESFVAAMKINHVAGAQKIYTPVVGGPIYERLDDKDADQKAFDEVVAKLRKIGLTNDNTSYGSAHQMGTCRMGPTPRMGACNDRGKVWERNGLYVADASLMPASSGVNPMITTQGLAEWVARGIVIDILKEEGSDTKSKL
ncbi:uncharacterized protein DFL_001690 [Arthrobotrys flagrans]|uniref:Long-chain-alcohol oxidase n=1 Tax=Arthrobotrys flagrans TaxID=97331 RepID=A0A437A8A1_ARTFL|nr:hypothetical protein DFL_001690 [Arthrobotrys flagrans]